MKSPLRRLSFGTFAVGLPWLLLCTADRRRALSRLWAVPVGFGVLVIAVLFSMPESVFGKKAVGVGLSRGMETIPISANDLVLARGGDVAAVSWLLKRTDILILGRGGEYQYGLKNYPEYASLQIELRMSRTGEEQEVPARRVVYIWKFLKKRPLPKDWRIVSSLERMELPWFVCGDARTSVILISEFFEVVAKDEHRFGA